MECMDIIITCKGRLEHLKQSLPKILKSIDEDQKIIVVDYDCPDGTSHFIEQAYKQKITCIKVFNKPLFNLADARNIGAKGSSSPMILFTDADVLFQKGALQEIQRTLNERNYVRIGPTPTNGFSKSQSQTAGTVAVMRNFFVSINGYNTVFNSWGGEDTDLYNKLDEQGLRCQYVSPTLVSTINHNNNMRTKFYKNKRVFSAKVNSRYLVRLLQCLRKNEIDLSLKTLEEIRDFLNKNPYFKIKNTIEVRQDSKKFKISFNRKYKIIGPLEVTVKKC